MDESEATEMPAPLPASDVTTPSPVLPAASTPKSRGSRGCGSVILGTLLVLVGIPMLICPGPGVAVILAGLGMIGVGLGVKKAGE